MQVLYELTGAAVFLFLIYKGVEAVTTKKVQEPNKTETKKQEQSE